MCMQCLKRKTSRGKRTPIPNRQTKTGIQKKRTFNPGHSLLSADSFQHISIWRIVHETRKPQVGLLTENEREKQTQN